MFQETTWDVRKLLSTKNASISRTCEWRSGLCFGLHSSISMSPWGFLWVGLKRIDMPPTPTGDFSFALKDKCKERLNVLYWIHTGLCYTLSVVSGCVRPKEHHFLKAQKCFKMMDWLLFVFSKLLHYQKINIVLFVHPPFWFDAEWGRKAAYETGAFTVWLFSVDTELSDNHSICLLLAWV